MVHRCSECGEPVAVERTARRRKVKRDGAWLEAAGGATLEIGVGQNAPKVKCPCGNVVIIMRGSLV